MGIEPRSHCQQHRVLTTTPCALELYYSVFNWTFLGQDLCQKLFLCNPRQIPYPWCKTCELEALWIFVLLILLSSDVHSNPGPAKPISEFSNGFPSLCNLNLNTLSKYNFNRLSLLQAHNTIFKYDMISLYETSQNKDIQVPEGIPPGYLYHPLNLTH